MRDLYIRLILRLIRPALKRYERETLPHRQRQACEAVFDDMTHKGGLIDTGLRSFFDIRRSGQ